MAFALIAEGAAIRASNTSADSPSIDTTGADLLVVAIGYLDSGGIATTAHISDNKTGNTWSQLTNYSPASGDNANSATRIFYCQNPADVGSGHVASVNTIGTSVPAISFMAFSGALTSGVADNENGNAPVTLANTAMETNAVTPSLSDCLLVAATCLGDSLTGIAVDDGFTLLSGVNALPSNFFGIQVAYKIQTTAAAVNPEFSATAPDFRSAALATFKSTISSGSSTPPIGRQLCS
jgi:hypothetical protein